MTTLRQTSTLLDVLENSSVAVVRASELLRTRRRKPSSPPRPIGIGPLDRLLGGGPARGGLTELIGRSSSGRFAALLAALAGVTEAGEPAALVDQGDHLDPRSALAAGVDLERLLWLRPRRLPDTLAAVELLLAAGFPLITVDLGLPPVRGSASQAAWIRLERRAAEHEAVVLIGAPYRVGGTSIRSVVTAGSTRGRWSGRRGTPRGLEGLGVDFELIRDRILRPGVRLRSALTLPEADFGAVSENESDALRKELDDVLSQ